MSFSSLKLLSEGLRQHRGWPKMWRSPQHRGAYDVVIVGGGGHGLASAYYLAKRSPELRIAVLERGWIGGGNTGRNTTVIRSNYFYPQSARLYDLSLRLYETLSRELNYNVMFSPRGMLIMCHSEIELELAARSVNVMRLNGVEADLLDAGQVRRRAPLLNFSQQARFPILGAIWQARAGTARHDAVAWGYARAADGRGVDIIQNCEVLGFILEGGVCKGVETSLGPIRAARVGLAVAGHSTHLARMAGISLPIQSYSLQAFVTEPLKPVIDTIAFSPSYGVYFSQSDKGGLVVGGGLDLVPSYARRGNPPIQDQVLGGLVEFAPALGKVKLLRQWAGTVDVTPDSSPILGHSHVDGLFLNCGWGTGGFKAIPAGGYLFAHLLATGEHHDISRPFDIRRFRQGRLIDEAAAAGIAH